MKAVLLISVIAASLIQECFSYGLCSKTSRFQIQNSSLAVGTSIWPTTTVLEETSCLVDCINTGLCLGVNIQSNGSAFDCTKMCYVDQVDPDPDFQYVSYEAEENEWFIVAGGWAGGLILKDADLFNSRTGEKCALPPMLFETASGVSMLMKNNAVICGGHTALLVNDNRCQYLDPVTMTWNYAGNLAAGGKYTASTFVPCVGWFLYSGYAGGLKSQFLDGLKGQWTFSAPVYGNVQQTGACMTQLNEKMTIITGSDYYLRSVILYNWAFSNYTIFQNILTVPRQYHGCATVSTPNLEPAVAIWSGIHAKGIELFNPVNKTSTVIESMLPIERAGNCNLFMFPFSSLSRGTEIIWFGGQCQGFTGDVSKYNFFTKQFTKIGSIFAKREHLAVPAPKGLSCS